MNAAVRDTANLSISGADPGTAVSATSVASGASGSETDFGSRVVAPIFAGETVSLVEDLGVGNTGSYTSQITCNPSTGFTAGEGGQGGTYEVPAAPVPVVCTVTNTRTAATLTLQKEWVNGASRMIPPHCRSTAHSSGSGAGPRHGSSGRNWGFGGQGVDHAAFR